MEGSERGSAFSFFVCSRPPPGLPFPPAHRTCTRASRLDRVVRTIARMTRPPTRRPAMGSRKRASSRRAASLGGRRGRGADATARAVEEEESPAAAAAAAALRLCAGWCAGGRWDGEACGEREKRPSASKRMRKSARRQGERRPSLCLTSPPAGAPPPRSPATDTGRPGRWRPTRRPRRGGGRRRGRGRRPSFFVLALALSRKKTRVTDPQPATSLSLSSTSPRACVDYTNPRPSIPTHPPIQGRHVC